MKAIRFRAHGGPQVLTYEDAPEPVPGPGEVLIRVRACALNHLDLFQRRGLERVAIRFPHISGADVAGEVVVAPDGEYAVGRRVMLQPGISCGRCDGCLGGRDNECPSYDVLGYQSDGGYAEYVKVPVQNLIGIPNEIEFVEAAAFPLTFLTAWHMLITRASLVAGEDVLVIGAGSGVGQAAIQLARRHGARVFATAGTDEKLAKARRLGALDVVNHSTENVPARVRELTGGRGVDVVVEHVGAATWDRSLKCLARSGRLVTCGATTGHDAKVDLRFLFGRQLSLLGSYMGRKSELLRAAQFFFSGAVKPVVDSTFPLSEASAAHRRLESRENFGKIVLVV
ncbi:MAG: zinc-binding dehydrogenase [Vicinamibacterales bacterium]